MTIAGFLPSLQDDPLWNPLHRGVAPAYFLLRLQRRKCPRLDAVRHPVENAAQ